MNAPFEPDEWVMRYPNGSTRAVRGMRIGVLAIRAAALGDKTLEDGIPIRGWSVEIPVPLGFTVLVCTMQRIEDALAMADWMSIALPPQVEDASPPVVLDLLQPFIPYIDAMIDCSCSRQPLISYAQWRGQRQAA